MGISCYNGFRSGLLPRIQCLSRSVTALSQRVYGRAARGGVYGVYLLAEDPDFLYYYQYAAKGRGVYGLIDSFERDVLHLQLGGPLPLADIARIEELDD